jgi:hypothetical protein
MSMSEMDKSTYRKHRALLRANGEYAFQWFKCPLVKEDFKFLISQRLDILSMRQKWNLSYKQLMNIEPDSMPTRKA